MSKLRPGYHYNLYRAAFGPRPCHPECEVCAEDAVRDALPSLVHLQPTRPVQNSAGQDMTVCYVPVLHYETTSDINFVTCQPCIDVHTQAVP